MIDKICTFPNQAIPSVYGESLSYTQQVAFLTHKVNECIDLLNKIGEGSLPIVTDKNNGWILQVENGIWSAADTLSPLGSRVLSLENSVKYQSSQIATINDTLNGLAQTIAALNGEVI